MSTINLLKIVLLFVFYTGIDFATAQEEEYRQAQFEHIALANQYRREFAKKFQIMNMHELVWDGNVEKIAQDNRLNYPPPKDFRYHFKPLLTPDSAKDWFREVLEDRNERYFRDHILEWEDGEMFPLELLLPAQKKVGCTLYDDSLEKSMCLLAPEVYFGSFFEARGAPGSKCDKGYTNNDGLCSLPKGT